MYCNLYLKNKRNWKWCKKNILQKFVWTTKKNVMCVLLTWDFKCTITDANSKNLSIKNWSRPTMCYVDVKLIKKGKMLLWGRYLIRNKKPFSLIVAYWRSELYYMTCSNGDVICVFAKCNILYFLTFWALY